MFQNVTWTPFLPHLIPEKWKIIMDILINDCEAKKIPICIPSSFLDTGHFKYLAFYILRHQSDVFLITHRIFYDYPSNQ